MKTVLVGLLIALTPLGLREAYADSDGYYCVGRGYLAYQFGMDVPSNPPRISILKTTNGGQIPAPVGLVLPPFQVHGMECSDGWVDVTAFDRVYRILLDGTTRPVRYETRPLSTAPASRPAIPRMSNLATLSRAAGTLMPERVALGATNRGTNYELVITAAIIPPAEQCRTAIMTRVVETDRSGRELGSRIVFKGEGRRECGE